MTVLAFNEVPTKLSKVMVYMERELKDDLERLSQVERRSMSQMALYLIEKGIKQAKSEGKI